MDVALLVTPSGEAWDPDRSTFEQYCQIPEGTINDRWDRLRTPSRTIELSQ